MCHQILLILYVIAITRKLENQNKSASYRLKLTNALHPLTHVSNMQINDSLEKIYKTCGYGWLASYVTAVYNFHCLARYVQP